MNTLFYILWIPPFIFCENSLLFIVNTPFYILCILPFIYCEYSLLYIVKTPFLIFVIYSLLYIVNIPFYILWIVFFFFNCENSFLNIVNTSFLIKWILSFVILWILSFIILWIIPSIILEFVYILFCSFQCTLMVDLYIYIYITVHWRKLEKGTHFLYCPDPLDWLYCTALIQTLCRSPLSLPVLYEPKWRHIFRYEFNTTPYFMLSSNNKKSWIFST